MTDSYQPGDLIVGYYGNGDGKKVYRCYNGYYAHSLDDRDGVPVPIVKIRNVERAAVPTVDDLIPTPKKRFVKAVIGELGDKNFHIFDHETRKYASFATEATRNVVVNDLNGGSEVSYQEWTEGPLVNNGREFRVTINPVVPTFKPKRPRYQAYTSAEREDKNFHIIDTETGKYTSYFQEETRNEMLARFNNSGVKYHVNWQNKPTVSKPVPQKDYSALIREAEEAAEAHVRWGSQGTANLLRRLKNAVRNG
jgi:hypothetical protein